jgi:hypothetical protein
MNTQNNIHPQGTLNRRAALTAIPFLAFAAHISTLADVGDCATIRAHAETLIDYLYEEHRDFYGETREKWIAEEKIGFADMVDMDDDALTEAERERACERADAQHIRRGGEV